MLYDKTKEPRMTKCDILKPESLRKAMKQHILTLLAKQIISKTTVI